MPVYEWVDGESPGQNNARVAWHWLAKSSCLSQPYLPIRISRDSQSSCRPPLLESFSEVALLTSTSLQVLSRT